MGDVLLSLCLFGAKWLQDLVGQKSHLPCVCGVSVCVRVHLCLCVWFIYIYICMCVLTWVIVSVTSIQVISGMSPEN